MKSSDFDENGEHGENGQLLKNRQWLNGNSNQHVQRGPVESGDFDENGDYGENGDLAKNR